MTSRLRARLVGAGALMVGASEREFRQAVNDLNHRLRHAAGEYTEPQPSLPVGRLVQWPPRVSDPGQPGEDGPASDHRARTGGG